MTKVEWIAKKPTPIDELDIFLQPKSKEDVPPFSMTIFDGKTCVEWSKKMNPEIELKDNYTYRLWKIVTIGGRVAFYFRPTSYFAFFNTCEALAFELAYWCYNNTPRAPIAIPRNLPHRGPSKHIFNLRSRNAALGLNVLSVFLNCRQGNRFYMQKRTTRKLAEGRNTITVVPSGTFQPDSYEGARGTDFSLRRAIFREFAEELLGRKEMERQAKHGQDFMNDKRLRPYLRAEQEGRLRIFFLGFGYDPVNGKGEMLLCIAMDANSIGISDFEKSLKSNWEGENFSVEWSKERLREFAARENTLGPGAACLDLVLRNFKKIDRLYFA